MTKRLLLYVQLELRSLGFGAMLELLFKLVALAQFVDFIIDFEVAGGNDLEEGIPVVLKEQDILICLVLSDYVSIAFGRQEPCSLFGSEALDEDPLPKFQMRVKLVF